MRDESFVNVRSVTDSLLSVLENAEELDHGSDEPSDVGLRVAIVVDSEGRLLYMRSDFAKLVGVDCEESIGMCHPFSWCTEGAGKRCRNRFRFLQSEEAREMGIDSVLFDMKRGCSKCLEVPARNGKQLEEGKFEFRNTLCLAVSDPAVIETMGVPAQTQKPNGGQEARQTKELEATWRRIGVEFERLGVSTGILGPPIRRSACAGLSSLSRREWEIVSLFMQGSRVTNIANALSISPHTVRNHLQSVYRKLEVRSQAELIEKLNGPARKISDRGEFPHAVVNE